MVLLRYLAVALVGLLPGFFLVGPALFADGARGERIVMLLVTGLVYLILGAAAGYFARSWAAGLALSLGGVIMAVLVAEAWTLTGLALMLVLGDACLGAWSGAGIRRQS